MIDPPAPDSAFRSDVGRVRTNNEDAVGGFEPADGALRAERGCLYVVADGMGGHAAGEVASNYAVASIVRDYFVQPWDGAEAGLRAAVAAANAAIHAEGSAPGDRQGMGCTVVAAALVGDRAVIINVGDSRAYLLRDGQLRQVSLDHSWIAERVAIGLLTPEEAAAHPGKNVLTRNLGFTPDTEPSVADLALQAGDRLLLCSDGLSGPVADYRIAALLGEGSAAQAANALIAAANGAGGPDNIGVAVIAVGAERAQPPLDRVEALPLPAWLGDAAAPAEPVQEAESTLPAATIMPATIEVSTGDQSAAAAEPLAADAAPAAATDAPAEQEPQPEPAPAPVFESPASVTAAPAAWPRFGSTPISAPAAAPSRPAKRSLLLGAVAAIVVLGALVAGGIVLAGRGSSRKTAVSVAATTTAVSVTPAGPAVAPSTPTPTPSQSPAATATTITTSQISALAPSPAAAATDTPSSGPANSGDGGGSAAAPSSPTAAPAAPGAGGATSGGSAGGSATAAAGSSSTASARAAGGTSTSGRAAAPATSPNVKFTARAGDTLNQLWTDCYRATIPDVAIFAVGVSALNPSVNVMNLRPGDEILLPGGWSGANCPLSGGQPE